MKNKIEIKETTYYGDKAYRVCHNGNLYGYIILEDEEYFYRPFEYYHPLDLLNAITKFIKENSK